MPSKVSGVIEKINVSGTERAIASSAYGYCETPASTAAKVVDMTDFKLYEGVTIHVKFANENSADNPTLNVNSTGAKAIVQYGTTAAGKTSATNGWYAGAVITLTYDGTSWVRDQGFNTNTWRGVEDSLTSDSTSVSLTAAQGKVLKGLIDAMDASTPAASGNATAFIDSLTQTDGKITSITKKTIPTASTSTAGIIKIGTTANDAAAGNHNHDTLYIKNSDELLTTNPFAPASLKGPYISKIDNAFYAADRRWSVTGTNINNINGLFNGNYESQSTITAGDTAVINIDFDPDHNNSAYFPGYPYGYILVSFYYTSGPSSISARVYCNYSAHGIGWHNLAFSPINDNDSSHITYRSEHQGSYNISQLEFTITAGSSDVKVTQIEMHLDRPSSDRTPFLSKYNAETLYYDLTAPKFIGALQGNADTATKFNSTRKIELTGAVTGSATTDGSSGWTISTTVNHDHDNRYKVASGVITLGSNTITPITNIAGLTGSTITAANLRTNLGLSAALRFIGKATTDMSESTTTAPTVTGVTNYVPEVGDVVLDKNSDAEYVCIAKSGITYTWELLGRSGSWATSTHTHGNITNGGLLSAASMAVVTDDSKKITTVDLSVTDNNASTNATTTFVQAVTQNAQGKITVTKASLNTSGEWSGNATTATTATSLASNPSIQANANNTNQVTITAGGKTSSPYTIPYATSAGSATTATYIKCTDTRNITLNPTDLTAAQGVRFDFKAKGTINLTATDGYAGVMSFRPYASNSDWSGGNAHQLAFNSEGLHWRNGGASWGNWYQILDSSNYTDYTVTQTGSGASGTWGISISGNATTADTATSATTATTADWVGKGSHTNTITANEFNPAVGTLTLLGQVANTTMPNTGSANAEMIIKAYPTNTNGTHYYEARLGFSSDGNLYYMPVDNTTDWKAVSFDDHTHTISLAVDTSASQNIFALDYGTNYKLTAGGSECIFAMPEPISYSTVSKSAAGLCPQLPNETTTTKFLRQDGNWVVPSYIADTHHTAYLRAGAENGTANGTTTTGNTYLLLVENNQHRSGVKLVPGSNMSIISDASGNVTFTSSYTDTKTTACSTNSTSKLFLIGAASQDGNYQETNSNQYVFETNGELSAKTLGINAGTTADKVTLQWNNSALEFVFT